jgi:hypothetical protein
MPTAKATKIVPLLNNTLVLEPGSTSKIRMAPPFSGSISLEMRAQMDEFALKRKE